MPDTWQIAKSRLVCCRCGAEFGRNSPFFSSLSDQDGELVREDFCTECWADPGDGVLCFWRARRTTPEEKRTVDTGLMLEFFDRLGKPDSEQKKIIRFVLALYLMRRKELNLACIRSSERGETMSFTRKGCGGAVDIENPDLTEGQIQQASAHLAQMLDATL
jgi:hypothetical protein